MPDIEAYPSLSIETRCSAGRRLTGEIAGPDIHTPLTCIPGQEECRVSCVLFALLEERLRTPGGTVAVGEVEGYCIIDDAEFVITPAYFSLPPSPEPIDPTMPF